MSDQGGVIPRSLLGRELKNLREQHHKKLNDISQELLISTSKLSRLENGQGLPQKRDVRDLIHYFDISGTPLAAKLMRWTDESRAKPWWDEITTVRDTLGDYFAFESAASDVHVFSAQLIPSLLQIGEYVRELTAAVVTPPPDSVDDVITVRLNRQAIWQREMPATVELVVDESALLRRVGSPEVMNTQLTRAAQVARDHDNVTVRIVALESGPHWSTQEGSFTVFHFPNEQHPDVAYPEAPENAPLKYFTDAKTVHLYLDRFDALTDRALSPEESIDRILQLAKDHFPI